MTLPRLWAVTADHRVAARILRGALRHEVEIVPLASPPASGGQHLLVLEVAGEGTVTLLADPAGSVTAEGYPLLVRPMTRPQLALLFAMVERLDEPSRTGPPTTTDDPTDDLDGSRDATLIDRSIGPARYSASSAPSSGTERDGALRPPVTTSLDSTSALVGRVVARKYRLESPVGTGSTAAVFRAVHLDLESDVAVKILHRHRVGKMQLVKRFKREARAASKLEHPNITRVIDFGEDEDGLLYLVMELLTGRSLEAILAAETRLTQRAAVRIAIQACSALAFAHDVGLIHRDIKPENIMIVSRRDDDGNPCDVVKVCDFGLAKSRALAPDQEELTTAGMLCGSPAYMSPEQTRGEAVDARTDIYSLGTTLYEMLTGRMPHDADDLAELFARRMSHAPQKPSSIAPEIHPLLDDVVLRSLAIDRTSRQTTARMLRADLRQVLTLLDADADADEPDQLF